MYPGVLDLEAAEAAQRKAEGQPLPKAEETPKAAKTKREKKPKRTSRRKKDVAKAVEPTAAETVSATACPDGASVAAKQVYEVLTTQPQPVDLLAEKAGMPIPVLLAALTELEMFGCVANSAGQQYMRS